MMKSKPLVSIIMPVYKTEDYIEAALQSVVQQSYDNIELICINDSSPDQAFEKCKLYHDRYNWIKLYENEKNSGQEQTRNRGLEVMRGKYVMFLDSDDVIASDMISEMVLAAEENHSDVVMSTYSMIYEDNETPILLHDVEDGVLSVEQFTRLLLEPIEWKVLCCIGTKLYSTQIIRENNLFFEKKYKYNEDGAFILSFLQLCKKISLINKPFYKYRIRSFGSTMSSYRPNMFDSISKVNILLKRLLEDQRLFEQKKELYFRKMLFIAIDSLRNEKKFGDKKSYDKVVRAIKNYPDFEKMLSVLSHTKKIGMKQKCVVKCMQMNMFSVLYYFI